MNTRYLFLMLGFPGSGKSYTAHWMAPHMQAVNLRGDDMRLHMFKEHTLEVHTWKYQQQLHGAMQYAVGQVLKAGYSVIYDSNHNSVKGRQPMQEVARQTGAIPVIVWVKTSVEVAKQRVIDRTAAGGHPHFNLDFVDRMANNLQPPTDDELCIIIDGGQSAEQQRKDFESQLATLAH
jgi:predicted kinase